jgi:predicted nucleic acid-binding protein
MAIAHYLVDKSVFARQTKPKVAERLAPLIEQGVIAYCGITEMEMIFSSRSTEDANNLLAWLDGLERLPANDEVFERAVKVQCELVGRSLHRSVKIADLLLAATAERHGVAVLHYDHDFDRIAEVTGQPVEWVVPPGEADLPVPPVRIRPIGSTPVGLLGGQTRVKPRSSATAACSLSLDAKA